MVKIFFDANLVGSVIDRLSIFDIVSMFGVTLLHGETRNKAQLQEAMQKHRFKPSVKVCG